MKFPLFVALALLSMGALAAPEEIQVYNDDINAPGQYGLELHNNYVMSGSGAAPYPGAQPPVHVWRLTPEFSYGLAESWEIGAYILSSYDRQGGPNLNGEKLRIKYLPRHSGPAYWGANLEVGKTSQRIGVNPWNAELKGIMGWKGEKWLLAANVNAGWSVSGPAAAPATLDFAAKASLELRSGFGVGLESYNAMGALRSPGNLGSQSQSLFGVIDAAAGKYDLNFGIGKNLTPSPDRWVLKFIVGMPL